MSRGSSTHTGLEKWWIVTIGRMPARQQRVDERAVVGERRLVDRVARGLDARPLDAEAVASRGASRLEQLDVLERSAVAARGVADEGAFARGRRRPRAW